MQYVCKTCQPVFCEVLLSVLASVSTGYLWTRKEGSCHTGGFRSRDFTVSVQRLISKASNQSKAAAGTYAVNTAHSEKLPYTLVVEQCIQHVGFQQHIRI